MIDGMAELVVAAAAWAAATAIAATIAYRTGYRRARRPFPTALRDDLTRHKRDCLREPPERIARELELYLGPVHRDTRPVPPARDRGAAAPATAEARSRDDATRPGGCDGHAGVIAGRRHTGAT